MASRQANNIVASERSIFSQNHDYNILNSFPCRGEHVRTYIISGSRCTWWQKTTNRHTHIHTHAGQPQYITIIIHYDNIISLQDKYKIITVPELFPFILVTCNPCYLHVICKL